MNDVKLSLKGPQRAGSQCRHVSMPGVTRDGETCITRYPMCHRTAFSPWHTCRRAIYDPADAVIPNQVEAWRKGGCIGGNLDLRQRTMLGDAAAVAGAAVLWNGLKPVWGPCLLALMLLHSSRGLGCAVAAAGLATIAGLLRPCPPDGDL